LNTVVFFFVQPLAQAVATDELVDKAAELTTPGTFLISCLENDYVFMDRSYCWISTVC